MSNEGFSTGLNSYGNERPRQSRSQANGAGTPPKVDSAAGPDAPILTGPARVVGYISSLSKTNEPPTERPKCATTRFSVEDKNSQIDYGSSRRDGLRGWDRTAGFIILLKNGFLFS